MLSKCSSTLVSASRLPDGRIDLAASLAAAQAALCALAAEDDAYTAKIEAAATQVWNDSNFRGLKCMGLSALVRLTLGKFNVVPDEATYKDCMSRLRMIVNSSSSVFLMLKAGANSNVYHLGRHSVEEIEKLMAQKGI